MATIVGGDEDDLPSLGSRDLDEFAPAPLPIGPDGAPTPGFVDQAEPLPPATPDNFVCLRGPCRHYMHLVEAGEWGNPKGTFEPGAMPKQHQHWCLAIPGQYLDMTEGMVYQCSRWDPVDDDAPEELARARRRSKYLALHPEHDPVAQEQATEELLREVLDADAAEPDDRVPVDGLHGLPLSPGQCEAMGIPTQVGQVVDLPADPTPKED